MTLDSFPSKATLCQQPLLGGLGMITLYKSETFTTSSKMLTNIDSYIARDKIRDFYGNSPRAPTKYPIFSQYYDLHLYIFGETEQ